MRVAVVFNLRREATAKGDAGATAGIEAEYDTAGTVEAVLAAVRAAGHQAWPVEAVADCPERLRRDPPDLVFNLAEGMPAEGREAQVPAVCDLLGIPYTGSRVPALALCLDKALTKRVLLQQGIPSPGFTVVPVGEAPAPGPLRLPLFVKPVREGSSMGVSPHSLVRDAAALAAQVAEIHAAYDQPALVEEFLSGREFTVGILGNDDPLVLPVTEIDYGQVPPGYPAVYSYQFKKEWDGNRFYPCPARLDPGLLARVRDTALAAYRAVRCLDVGRVDLRLDASGTPHVLEINPLPGLAPGFSDLPRQAEAAGMPYEALVAAILRHAQERHGLTA